MPDYLSPGVYTEEPPTSGNAPIEGSSTSTAGMIGVTERGPVNIPILITSYGEYTYWFGGRLNIDEFSFEATGAHCYLPHAVEGFFTNLGKRVYVCRILDSAALPAAMMLFDRGEDGGTQLIRFAPQNTGSAATPPPLYLLDHSAILSSSWFRVGDGSASDYVERDTATPVPPDDLIPLSLPFARYHDTTEPVQVLAPKAALSTTLTLVVPTNPINTATSPADATALVITGSTADIAALASGALIEVGPTNQGELRFITKVTNIDSTHVTLTLDGGLVGRYVNGVTVTNLTLPSPPGAGAPTLDTAVALGAPLIFAAGPAASPQWVVIGQPPGTATPAWEARRIGVLSTLTLSSDVYEAYPSGTVVTNVTFAGPPTIKTAAAAGSSSVTVNDASGLSVGMALVVAPAASDTVTVDNIGAAGTITFHPALGATVYAKGSSVSVLPAGPGSVTLVQATTNGATSIVVSDASGISIGNQLVLGPQKVWIQAITAPTTTNPKWTIDFSPALVNAFAVGDPLTLPTTALSAAAPAGASTLSLTTRLGISVGDVIKVDGINGTDYVTIGALPSSGGPPPDAGIVVLDQDLSVAHAVTDSVTRLGIPSVPAANTNFAPTVTAVTAELSTKSLVVADESVLATGIIQVTTPAGDVYFHDVSALTPITAGGASGYGQVFILPAFPLEQAHSAGAIVLPRNPLLNVQALDAGGWGNRLRIAVADETRGLVAATTLTTVIDPTHIKLASAAGVEPGTVLQLLNPGNKTPVNPPIKVQSIDRSSRTVVLDAPLQPAQLTAQAATSGLAVRSMEFSITVTLLRQPDPAIPSRNLTALDSEVFHNLSMDPRHSRYVQTIIGDINGPHRLEDNRPEGQSWYIRVHDTAQDLPAATQQATLNSVRLGPEPLTDTLPDGGVQPAQLALFGGDDSIDTITDATYIGDDNVDPVKRTGLFSLMNVDNISIISAPGRVTPEVQGALITQCETMRYRVAVLDGPRPPDDSMNDVMAQRQQFDTKYAALYYPWLLIPDPFPTNLDNVAMFPIPPSGHVVGIYARVDEQRGVQKAPANEIVNGILGLQRTLYQPQQDILNPYPVNINVIRDFRPYDRGIVVYGARIITSDSDWKYVNVRRLVIFIESSIYNGLQWVVFEPNDSRLWARVRRSITNFLNTVWRNGGLQGDTADQAFFVKCDSTTMTQTDIDNGRLIILVGLAPVMPAEFVIVRIGLMTAQAES